LKSRRYRDALVFGLALLVLLADQLSKAWVRRSLVMGVTVDPLPWLRPVLRFTYITNTGAAFGLFPDLGVFYIVVSFIVIGFIVFFYRNLPAEPWILAVSLGLQLGGSLGNLTDRLRFGGQVTDFLDFNFWPMQDWPLFNVADSSLVLGACILAAFLLFSKDALGTLDEGKRVSSQADPSCGPTGVDGAQT